MAETGKQNETPLSDEEREAAAMEWAMQQCFNTPSTRVSPAFRETFKEAWLAARDYYKAEHDDASSP